VTTSGRRECAVCGWAYDPDLGDDDGQVAPGVAFEDLPVGWVCPRCAAPKERFVRQAGAEAGGDSIARLVAAYRVVETRMRGLAVCNPALSVQAIGFQLHGGVLVGALVTPWFLNLVVIGRGLPPAGETVEVDLPGGRFELHGATEGVPHLALSLISPMTDVVDQRAARAIAEETVRLALTEPRAPGDAARARTRDTVPSPAIGRRALLTGLLGG
jgi:[NiFe] hydrogenase assembly HybE family chaperone